MSNPGWLDAEDRRVDELDACRRAIERGLVDIDLPLESGAEAADEDTHADSDSRALIRDALTSGFGVLCTMRE